MSFNWLVYKILNTDLEKKGIITKEQIWQHYITHGKKENRLISIYQLYPDFNYTDYKNMYSDLYNMTKEELEVHWIKNGKNEGRIYNNYKLINGIDIIYWINLDRSVDRRTHMEGLLSKINVPNRRISASDGKLDSNMMNNFNIKNIDRLPGEYGCLLSHLRTIQIFWKSSLNVGLILEDDMSLEFNKYWKKDIKTIVNEAPPNWEILMLSYTDYEVNKNNLPLYRSWKDNIYSTVAYLINKKGANKILQMYSNNKWNIDIAPHVADHVLYTKCVTYVYKYCYFTTNDLGGSYIHADNLPQHQKAKKIALDIWLN